MTDVDPTGAVLVETDGAGVRTLTFNRPERRNGWASDLEDAYYAALTDAAADPAVRAVVVTGAGPTFCPGADMGRLGDLAAELVYTGRMVEAAEADRVGLVTRVVDDPLAAAHALAARIAAVNPDAIRADKRLLRRAHGPLEDGLAAERAAMGEIMGSPNQREAAAAGLEKREPRFT